MCVWNQCMSLSFQKLNAGKQAIIHLELVILRSETQRA